MDGHTTWKCTALVARPTNYTCKQHCRIGRSLVYLACRVLLCLATSVWDCNVLVLQP